MGRSRKILVLTLDAAGNWPPERSLVRALCARGHRVRVVSDTVHERDVASAGGEFTPYEQVRTRLHGDRPTTDEPEIVHVLREVFFNTAYADELECVHAAWQPDVLLIDSMLLTATSAAERLGRPTAVLWHTVFGAMMGSSSPFRGPFLDGVNAFRARRELAPVTDRLGTLANAQAVLAFTHEAFDEPLAEPLPSLHYVGPLACLPDAVPPAPYRGPWPASDTRPLVLVSFSTSFQDQVATLQRVADAAADVPARFLLTLGGAIAADELRLPSNVAVESFVPHAAVLPQAQLVVTHAGHGTVMAAVTAGVPLVCLPMGRDQHQVAGCVAARQLGVVVPMTIDPADLRRVLIDALADTALRERASAFARTLDVRAGLTRAVEVVENL